MRIYPKVTIRLTDAGFYAVPEAYYEYFGPLWGAKKGDKEKEVGGQQQAYANKEQGIQDTYRADADPFAKSLMSTTPGQMSPYAAAQYGSDVENISNTYNNLRQNAVRSMGAKGFGNAPSGFNASMNNNVNNQQAQAQTGAFRTGLQSTLNQGLEGANYFQKGQSMYNPDSAYSGATQSYNAGDTQAGNSWKTAIGGVEGLASMFVPGGGFASLMKGGGGGTNFGGLPGGSASNMGSLPLGDMGSSMSAFNPMTSLGAGSGFGKYANSGVSKFGMT